MDDETAHSSAAFSNLSTEELRGRIMLIALSSLFIAVIFVLLLHLYAKLFWWRVEHRHHQRQHAPGSTTARRHRHGSLVFATDQELLQATGLDPSVLKSIPVVAFKQQDFKNGLECSVCLSDLIEGEKARVLPNCNHGFHVDCIDMWFQSHSTCPLCRDKIGSEDEESVTVNIGDDQNSGNGESQNSILNSGYSTESSNFPTNILVWGDQNQVSSTGAGSIETTVNPNSGIRSTGTGSIEATVNPNSGNRNLEETRLVINVPENVIVNSLSSSSARFMEEDPKSPVVVSRLRSLKRLLSREKKAVISSSSSSAPAGE